MEGGIGLWRNTRTGEDEKPLGLGAVDRVADGIPQDGSDLPFIQKTGLCPLQEDAGADLGEGEILGKAVRVVQREDALCGLLRRGGFSAPFRTFDQNSTLDRKFVLQKGIRDAFAICFHRWQIMPFFEGMSISFGGLATFRSASWRGFDRRVGGVLVGELAVQLTKK